ncbi:MAG: orotidine 5'-phosphate decarboxylase / HUMPS family protein [Acetobacteraceae bacterium]
MQLQVALDCPLDPALSLLARLGSAVDRAELGTPLLLREGLHAARIIREKFRALPMTADAKIMDAGELEAGLAFQSGCDIVTALAAASDQTIAGAVRAAQRHSARIMADMIAVPDPVGRAHRLWELGVHLVCVHTAFDVQSEKNTPLAALSAMRSAFPDRPIAVAGGIGLATLGPVLMLRPEIIIVGGTILNAADPLAVARELKARITHHG